MRKEYCGICKYFSLESAGYDVCVGNCKADNYKGVTDTYGCEKFKNINDCDYCSKQEVYLEQYEADEGSIRKLDIVFIPDLRHLRVRILDDRENTPMNYGIDERFNYCPMCGRKL